MDCICKAGHRPHPLHLLTGVVLAVLAVLASGATQAQQTPPMTVDVAVQAEVGGKARLPVKVAPQFAANGTHLMLHKVPNWISITSAEAVGAGVWLIAPGQLDTAELVFAAGATGSPEVIVSLLAKDGKIVTESKLVINVRPASAPAPKDWTSLVAGSDPAKRTPPKAGPAKGPTAAVQASGPKGTAKSAVIPARGEAQLVDYAKHLVRECTTCHSLYGQDAGIPVMIGLPRERFIDTMRLYKMGRRENPAMQVVSQSLDDEQTLALALYLGRIKPPPPETRSVSATSIAAGIRVPEVRAALSSDPKVERWVARGLQLLNSGDIAQSRLLFERAAEMGSGLAMLRLANTYDPNALPWRPGMGLEAEPLKARRLYVEAKKLGAGEEADQRLADLPER